MEGLLGRRRCCSGSFSIHPFPSPVPSHEARQKYIQEIREANDRAHSIVLWQYRHQVQDEKKRLSHALRDWNPRRRAYVIHSIAVEIVQQRWVDQGTWDHSWPSLFEARWKHEEDLELGSELRLDSEREAIRGLYNERSRRSKTLDERQADVERVALRSEREASRPVHQYIYQVCREKERHEYGLDDMNCSGTVVLDVKAYENVKDRWIKLGM